jgi:RNA polymerase sigma-70 factor (ECF subfamily)
LEEFRIVQTYSQVESGEVLFRRYLDGDTRAFEYVVDLYQADLAHYIYALVYDVHTTEDIVIEAFAQLALRGGHFSGRSSLKTYLFTIGKNLAMKHLRKRGKERHISIDELEGVLTHEGGTPEATVELDETKKRLHDAMGKIKKDHRTVLTLLYFEDMSYVQAGQSMGKSEEQIKQLVFRAKQSLRKKLTSR